MTTAGGIGHTLPFLIAGALAHGRVGIGEVAAIDDARVLDLATRIEGRLADATPDGETGVTVRLQDGRVATIRVTQPLGSPGNRLSVTQLRAKFADCARNAAHPISEETITRTLHRLEHLEETEDHADLLRDFI